MRVCCYLRVDGVWTLTAVLNGENTAYDDRFGHSLSISGDGLTVAVGAIWATGPSSDDGLTYIFKLINGVWTIWQSITSEPHTHAPLYFGEAVSLNYDGTVLAVGGTRAHIGTWSSGAVYIFP